MLNTVIVPEEFLETKSTRWYSDTGETYAAAGILSISSRLNWFGERWPSYEWIWCLGGLKVGGVSG